MPSQRKRKALAEPHPMRRLLQGDPPILPIIGGSRPEQLEENLGSLNVTLSGEQVQRLTTAGDPDVKKAWLR